MPDPYLISGEPGDTWTNDTGKVRFQFLVSWANSCGLCISYDHQIGPSWPIPLHNRCRCVSVVIKPGGTSRPFVNFIEKIEELPIAERNKVVGVSNWKLIREGVVDWKDVVTPARVRDLREVVSLKGLSLKTLRAAGIDPKVAERAYAAVHTEAHQLAEESRRRLVEALKAKGVSREEAKRAVAERLAGRVSVGGKPMPPPSQPPPTAPKPPPPLAPPPAPPRPKPAPKPKPKPANVEKIAGALMAVLKRVQSRLARLLAGTKPPRV